MHIRYGITTCCSSVSLNNLWWQTDKSVDDVDAEMSVELNRQRRLRDGAVKPPPAASTRPHVQSTASSWLSRSTSNHRTSLIPSLLLRSCEAAPLLRTVLALLSRKFAYTEPSGMYSRCQHPAIINRESVNVATRSLSHCTQDRHVGRKAH